jgi:hypothetical protein
MARVYAPAPAPGPIETSLAGKTSTQRATMKATAIRSAKGAGYSYTLDGITITLTGAPVLVANGTGVSLTLSATSPTGPLPLDNPYIFINPPVKVPNGTWRVVNGVDRENYKEDIVEALQRMVLDAVLLFARQRGWQG